MSAPTWLQALLLGIVQGLTEFVPVSSSAHLVLVPAFLGWPRPGLAFDVALHIGTLVALIVYYRRDLAGMSLALVSPRPSPRRSQYRRLLAMLTVASIPVAIAGLALRSTIEIAFERPRVASALLFATAVLLLAGERLRARRLGDQPPKGRPQAVADEFGVDPDDPEGVDLTGLRPGRALLIGAGQALALLPGLSRSGTTITAGLAVGMTRPAATRFAFLLALPAIAGATLISLPDMDSLGGFTTRDLLIGIAASAASGYLAIAGLVKLVARAGLERFAIYLAVVGTVGLVRFR